MGGPVDVRGVCDRVPIGEQALRESRERDRPHASRAKLVGQFIPVHRLSRLYAG